MNEKSAIIAMNCFPPIPGISKSKNIAENLSVEKPARRPAGTTIKTISGREAVGYANGHGILDDGCIKEIVTGSTGKIFTTVRT